MNTMIELTSPEGKILINANLIEAVVQKNPIKGIDDTKVLVNIYCASSPEPYNITEPYEKVLAKFNSAFA